MRRITHILGSGARGPGMRGRPFARDALRPGLRLDGYAGRSVPPVGSSNVLRLLQDEATTLMHEY